MPPPETGATYNPDANPRPRVDREFPCAQCGAALKFTPGTLRLTCDYCGYTQEIAQSATEIRELPFDELVATARLAPKVLEGVDGERRCDACGAHILINTRIATDECPFCGTHLDNPLTPCQPMMPPQAVLPFGIAEQQAKAKFREWVASRWFAPNNFKRMADLGKVSGLYVPYWTFDAMTVSYYTGERGEAYYVTVRRGNSTVRERRIRWYPASGRVDHWFDDVLVCASNSLPGPLVQELEPWDLHDIKPFDSSFLSGFRSERYQIDAKDGFEHGKGIMDSHIRTLVRRDIGGDEQRIHSVATQHSNVTFKHILLPIWLAAYRYHDKSYRVLVNARTGEVQGERPWSWIKIALAVLAGLAVIGAIVYAANQK